MQRPQRPEPQDLSIEGETMPHPGKFAFTAVLAAWVASPAAFAAPCAGFTDVDTSSGFCKNVEWVKNRKVTTGCTSATLYCPNDPVSRLAMAAFMNRLGNALTPTQLRVDTAPGAVNLDGNMVVCQTGDYAVADYPRTAYLDVAFNGTAASDVGLAADLAMSTDGGANWTNLNTIANRGSVTANQWGGLADIGFVDLDVGQNVRWGVRMTRGGIAGTAHLSDSRCQLRALVYSRTGAATPF
jgi:hypothetical protein